MCVEIIKVTTSAPTSPGGVFEPSGKAAPPDSPFPSATLPVQKRSDSRTKWPQTGEASWYGPKFHGKTTASGDTFDQEALTAAHASLPFGSKVKVTNLSNGKSVEVEINDRGPFFKNRIIDVSRAAAKVLDMKEAGTTNVRVDPLAGE